MTVVLDEDGCRMWIDDFSPILFIKFSAMPSGKSASKYLARKCKNAWQQLTDKSDCVYSVIDTRDCKETCPLALMKFCFDYFPALLRGEMKYFAVVTPPASDQVIEKNLSQMIAERTQAKYGCFSDFFGALGCVNTLRQQII